MGPLPKRKTSSTRRNKRRSHDKLAMSHLVVCPQCGGYTRAHHVCPNCGTYRGREVIAQQEEE